MASDVDIAWAAGLFEGEGCFMGQRAKGSRTRWIYFACSLRMTDEDVVRRFASIVGCGTVREHQDRRPNRQTTFDWSVGGDAAIAVAEMLLPYLGHRRTQTVRVLMDQARPSEAICGECEAPFAPKDSRSRFCSDRCRHRNKDRERAEYFREYHRRRRTRLASDGQIALVPDAA